MKAKRLLNYILLTTLIISATGCVRYIDSRKQLTEQYSDDGFDPAQQRAGVEGFYRYEQEQRKRLEGLINDRKASLNGSSYQSYVIDQGDEIDLFIKDFPQVSKTYTVGTDGRVRLPVIGKVKLAGLSEEAAENKISSIAKDYVLQPQVDLSVTQYSNNIVWLMSSNNNSNGNGTVNNRTEHQTAIPLKRQNYTLTELLVELGDPSIFERGVIEFYPSFNSDDQEDEDLVERFNNFSVKDWSGGKDFDLKDCDGNEYQPEGAQFRVKACYPYKNDITNQDIRAKYEKGAKIEIDLEELFGGRTKAPIKLYLKPGDLVRIPQPPVIQVFGEVNQRGSFIVNAGGGGGQGSGGGGVVKPTLLSLITEARGLTFSADINEVLIYREIHFGNKAILSINLEKVVLWAGQDIRLRDGDIVYIPSKSNRFAQQQSVNAINQITGSITNVDRAIDVNGGR